ncbi:MAG TPA: 8-oxoguanine deaminase [Desertimonas sp.]|nr:8-oxoguanine deaminase [Desertimonas sp.]
MHDLVIAGGRLVATMDDERRELEGGWVAINGDTVAALGGGPPPGAQRVLDATDCLVTPGLVNTHHHLFQNLTRAYPPMTDKSLFGWLQSLYPLWAALDTEAAYLSAWVGLAELALSGCTTSSDHLYLHPRRAGDLLAAEIEAARELGMRFHPTRGSMSLSEKDGGLPPDDVVADDDEILVACEEAVSRHHDRSYGAMIRIALAPCSPFTVTESLMVRSAELAERVDVRLHTHFAENAEDDAYSLARFGVRPTDYLDRTGWLSDRTWLAHCVMPDPAEVERLGAAQVGVAHCPSSNLMLSSGIAPIVALRTAGVSVGLGVDGSSSADSASLWLEARQAMLLAKLRDGAAAGTARLALELATRGGAACLGRRGELGELRNGAMADVAVWPLSGPAFAGAIADPVEAWLRCGPVTARHTVVGGAVVVQDGHLVNPAVEERLADHRRVAAAMQRLA